MSQLLHGILTNQIKHGHTGTKHTIHLITIIKLKGPVVLHIYLFKGEATMRSELNRYYIDGQNVNVG